MSKRFLFVLILLLAIFFRFNNLNWDANQHLHPDERFLTMVGSATKIPTSFFDYFNPQTSTLNPANVGYKFFVYGRFPLIINKILAVIFSNDNYNNFTIQGRFLSALFDLLIVFLVYKTAQLLIRMVTGYGLRIKKIPLWSAFFYAIAVLPIQLSHFFAVDSFLSFFMFGSFYLALKFYTSEVKGGHKNTSEVFFSAIFFGLALASKITAIYILPLNLLLIIMSLRGAIATKQSISFRLRLLHFVRNDKVIIRLLIYILVTYLTLRIVDPYFFQSANFFDPRPSQVFTDSLKTHNSFTGKDVWYPPAVQWIHKPAVLFSLVNLIVFGVGIPYFNLIVMGIYQVIHYLISDFGFRIKKNSSSVIRNQKITLLLILIWVILFFLYQSTQFAKPMRYFIFIYPFLAIFAAIGITQLINYACLPARQGLRITDSKIIRYSSFVIIILILLIWPLMFSSIYFYKHTRVEASEWIYSKLETGSLILDEEWDDPLPLGMKETHNKQFQIEILPVFGQDTPEKWQKMNELLKKADYYVLSSNRGWGSIPTVPEKYPKMSQFYNDLLTNQLNYQKIKEFKPFYYRFFELPNHWVDESFTVYDHPTVMMFKNEKNIQ